MSTIISSFPHFSMDRFKDYAGYAFVACYIINVPAHRVFPISLITIGTAGALLLFIGDAPAALAAFHGRARVILILLGVLYGYQVAVYYVKFGAMGEGFVFIPAAFCVVLIAGRARMRRNGLRRLIVACLAVLAVSMLWFLSTYASESLYQFHMRLFIYDGYLLTAGMRSGLAERPHVFGYHLVPLSICLLTIWVFAKGRLRRLTVGALLLAAGVTVLLYGERSVFLAIALGLAALGLRPQYRGKAIALGLVLAIVFAGVILEQSLIDLEKSRVQKDLFTRFTDKELHAEAVGRIQLQMAGVKVLWDHPEGLYLAEESLSDLVTERDAAVFDSWGGPMGVHNGYLAWSLQYGWLYAFLLAPILWNLLHISRSLLLTRSGSAFAIGSLPMLGAALLGLLAQGLFHHPSLASLDPATLVFLLLALSAYSTIRADEHLRANASARARRKRHPNPEAVLLGSQVISAH